METWITDVKNLGLGLKMNRTAQKMNVHKNGGTVISGGLAVMF